tara:strand:+ start:343 stop:519 length:177 start_codon:yes stop_codon:yes gene_type:complete
MRKFLYELGAAATVVFGMIPMCIVAGVYSAYLTIIETAKIFPLQIYTLFEIWYRNKER